MTPHSAQPCALCHLCGRIVPAHLITLHHLRPKQKGGKADQRVAFCKPCHKQVHATFDNAALARMYSDLQILRSAPQLQPFLNWIRKQKPGRNFRTVTSNSHPRSKRHRLRERAHDARADQLGP